MNRTLVLVSALSAGLMTTAGISQTAPAAAASAPSAAPAAVEPQAIPAKIALVAFEQAVFATNEGQRAVQQIQDKYKPKKDQIDTLSKEVDSLKAQLQSAPATLSDEERATRLRNIDTKEKELNRNAEDAQTAYNADLQEAYGKVAAKVSVTLKDKLRADREKSGDAGIAQRAYEADASIFDIGKRLAERTLDIER